jgi:FkbM family methyltransferase
MFLAARLLFSRRGRWIWLYRLREFRLRLICGLFHPDHVSVRSPFGTRWILPTTDPILKFYYTETDFDRAGMKACLSLIQKDDVVIDGGANFGLYSKLFSDAVGPRGLLVAIEPFEQTAVTLRRQLRNAATGQVRIIQAPLWSREVSLCLVTHFYQGCQRVRWVGADVDGEPGMHRVQAVTLDRIQADLDGRLPSLIKLDIEGSELEALKGASRVLGSRSPPWLYVEINAPVLREQGVTECQLMDHLIKECGYRLAVFDGERSGNDWRWGGRWRWTEPEILRDRLSRKFLNVLAQPPRGAFCERGSILDICE